MIYKSKSYKIFSVFNYVFLSIITFLCILPLIHVFAVSLSGSSAATANIVKLIPVDFTLDAYKKTIGNENFIRALGVGIYRVILGTIVSMTLMTFAAYSLSKEDHDFKGRKYYVWFFVFTMLFSGGLVPSYIIVTKVGLINSIWALVLPVAVNAFNLILLLNFFRTAVPKSLEEAAYMDGA